MSWAAWRSDLTSLSLSFHTCKVVITAAYSSLGLLEEYNGTIHSKWHRPGGPGNRSATWSCLGLTSLDNTDHLQLTGQWQPKRALKDTRKLPSWPIKPSDPWGGQVQLLSERCWLRATPVPPAPSILGTCPGRETETPPCTGCTGSRAW